jgi:hypothetical protein
MFRPFGFPAPKTIDLFGFLFKKHLRVHGTKLTYARGGGFFNKVNIVSMR